MFSSCVFKLRIGRDTTRNTLKTGYASLLTLGEARAAFRTVFFTKTLFRFAILLLDVRPSSPPSFATAARRLARLEPSKTTLVAARGCRWNRQESQPACLCGLWSECVGAEHRLHGLVEHRAACLSRSARVRTRSQFFASCPFVVTGCLVGTGGTCARLERSERALDCVGASVRTFGTAMRWPDLAS